MHICIYMHVCAYIHTHAHVYLSYVYTASASISHSSLKKASVDISEVVKQRTFAELVSGAEDRVAGSEDVDSEFQG